MRKLVGLLFLCILVVTGCSHNNKGSVEKNIPREINVEITITGEKSIHNVVDVGDGIIAIGYVESNDGIFQNMNKGWSDCLIIKVSYSGEIEWVKSFGGTSFESAYDIKQFGDGFVITGVTSSTDIDFQDSISIRGEAVTFISYFDKKGELIWNSYYTNGIGSAGEVILVDGEEINVMLKTDNNEIYIRRIDKYGKQVRTEFLGTYERENSDFVWLFPYGHIKDNTLYILSYSGLIYESKMVSADLKNIAPISVSMDKCYQSFVVGDYIECHTSENIKMINEITNQVKYVGINAVSGRMHMTETGYIYVGHKVDDDGYKLTVWEMDKEFNIINNYDASAFGVNNISGAISLPYGYAILGYGDAVWPYDGTDTVAIKTYIR